MKGCEEESAGEGARLVISARIGGISKNTEFFFMSRATFPVFPALVREGG